MFRVSLTDAPASRYRYYSKWERQFEWDDGNPLPYTMEGCSMLTIPQEKLIKKVNCISNIKLKVKYYSAYQT